MTVLPSVKRLLHGTMDISLPSPVLEAPAFVAVEWKSAGRARYRLVVDRGRSWMVEESATEKHCC